MYGGKLRMPHSEMFKSARFVNLQDTPPGVRVGKHKTKEKKIKLSIKPLIKPPRPDAATTGTRTVHSIYKPTPCGIRQHYYGLICRCSKSSALGAS